MVYGLSCSDYKNSFVHKYHPVRHCQRSNKTVIGMTNATTVEKCAEYAEMRKAMSFNFSPLGRGHRNFFEKPEGVVIWIQIFN